jgi:phosphomannomutase
MLSVMLKSRVIVCDMDGTLAKSRQPAESEMLAAIEKISKNYAFVIITGGKLSLIQDQITSLIKDSGVKLYLFPTSGNQFWIYLNGEYENIYQNKMNTDDQNLILNSIIGCINRFNLTPFTDDQIELRESQITFSILGRNAPYELKANYDPNGIKRKLFVEYMKENNQRLASDFEVRIGGTTSIDFTYKGMDKGFGLIKIKEHFQVDNREIIFFGDKCFEGGNDWEIAREVPFVQVKDEYETLEKFNKIINNEPIEIYNS